MAEPNTEVSFARSFNRLDMGVVYSPPQCPDDFSAASTPQKNKETMFMHLQQKTMVPIVPTYFPSSKDWGTLVGWCGEIVTEFAGSISHPQEVLFAAFQMLIDFFSKKRASIWAYQGLTVVAIYVAWKNFEVDIPRMSFLKRLCDNLYPLCSIADFELALLKSIDFNIPTYTIWTAVDYLLTKSGSSPNSILPVSRKEYKHIKMTAFHVAKLLIMPEFGRVSYFTIASIILMMTDIGAYSFDTYDIDVDGVLEFMRKNERNRLVCLLNFRTFNKIA
jgi:hypothetical protein